MIIILLCLCGITKLYIMTTIIIITVYYIIFSWRSRVLLCVCTTYRLCGRLTRRRRLPGQPARRLDTHVPHHRYRRNRGPVTVVTTAARAVRDHFGRTGRRSPPRWARSLGGGARFSVAAATAGGHAHLHASSVARAVDSRLILLLIIPTMYFNFFFRPN